MRTCLLLLLTGVLGVPMPAHPASRAGEGPVRIASPSAQVDVRRARFRLRVRAPGLGLLAAEDRRGGLYYQRADNVAHALTRVLDVAALPDGAVLTVDTDEGVPATVTLRWRTAHTLSVVLDPPTPETVVAFGERLRSPRTEAIYGLTERLRDSPPIADGVIDIPRDDIQPVEVGSLDRRGETVAMYVRPTFALYAPFFQSSRGYGLAVEGTTVGEFDVAHADPRVLGFRFESGNLPEHRRFAFDIFVGPDHAEILDEYTALTGRPLVPPAWAFLHWRWRDDLDPLARGTVDGVTVQGQVADDLAHYEALGLPAGVWNFDRPVLQGEFGFSRFDWNASQLPNQADLLVTMRQRGWRTVTWSSCWTCGSCPGDNGLEAEALGYHAPGATPALACDPLADRSVPARCADIGGARFILDVTNPAAQPWWRGKVATLLAAQALDGIKLDRGEEHIPSATTDIWADGRTGREARNAYPTLQAKLHHEALQQARPDGDFVLITRAGYTGTAAHAIVWGGDIPGSESFGAGPGTDLGLRSAIISQQRAAFMGYPIWGSDTGGYYEFKDREVFARWLEFSTFSGIMEIGGKGNRAPWDMPTTPRVDDELISIYTRFVTLRHTLQSYIVAAAAEAARGLPLVRPMPFLDRTDAKLRDRWDQYLFGPDLLVAPVWKIGQRQREVYFPRGMWRDYWDPTQVVRGPTTRVVDAPLDRIPVYVRAGAVVPGP